MPRKLLHLAIVLITLATGVIFTVQNNKNADVFYGDALGYYAYLPSTFIYHNLKGLDQFPADKGIPDRVMPNIIRMGQSSVRTPKGYRLNQYTYGVALMEAPFFFAAHAFERATGQPGNGFSATYEQAIRCSAIVFVLVGLFITWRMLRRYFSPTISLLTVALLYLATNLFWFTLIQPGMSHQPVFMLYALLIWLTIRLYEAPSGWRFVAVGFVAGLITVIRPTDIVCAGIPLLYGVYDRSTLNARLRFIRSHARDIVLLLLVAFIPAIPQLVFWKALTGSFLFYSYGNQPFFWKHPKLIEGLFYFKNGFFAYCPVFLMAVAGMLWYRRPGMKSWALAIVLIFPVYSYVIYSWYCYNYINGLGSRPMIHLYPLFAVPLAAFLEAVSRRRVATFAVATVLVFFISVNYSLSALKANWKLNSEEANIHYCWQMLYRTDPLRYNDFVVFDVAEFQPDTARLQRVTVLGTEHFNDSLDAHFEPEIETGAKYVYRLDSAQEHLPHPIVVRYSESVFRDASWLKCSGRFRFHVWPDYRDHILTMIVTREGRLLKKAGMKIDNKIGLLPPYCPHKPEQLQFFHYENDRWGYEEYFTRLPNDIREGDKIELGIWNLSRQEMFIDSMKLEAYR